MSQVFDKAFELVLKYEGGYVNDPNDPGGETKYGICKRQYPNLDIENLTKEQAKEIYKKDYWNKIKGDDLPPRVAIFLLQCAVNVGVKTASKMLQRATRTFLKNKPGIDGIIGPKTIAAVKQVDEDKLLAELTVQQCRRYAHLCIKNPKFAKYIKGWLRRAVNSMQFAIKEV